MLGLLSLLPGLFGTINGITTAISNERLKLIQAKTDKEKIDAQENIATLQMRRDVMMQKSGQWETRLMMFALGIGPTILLSKIYVYDKAFGQWTNGTTDKLDDNLWWVITAQIGFYFLASIFKK